MHAMLLQSCLALCDPTDCSLPGSSVWDFPGKCSGFPSPPPVVFPTQGSNLHLLCLLPWQVGSLPLVPPGKPIGDIRKYLYYLRRQNFLKYKRHKSERGKNDNFYYTISKDNQQTGRRYFQDMKPSRKKINISEENLGKQMNSHITEVHTHIAYMLMKKMLNITNSQENENILFPIHQFGWFNLTVLSS